MASKINFNGFVIEMPTKISQLENDANFVNEEGLASSGYASQDYVEQKVAELVNSAPETLDTLGEVAQALAQNDTVVQALNSAIGKKANTADLPTIGTRYYEGNQGFAVVSSDGTENGIYFKNDDFNTAAAGPIPNDYRTITLKNVVRTTDVAQDIAGTKNFTGSLQKNGVEVATTNDIPTIPTIPTVPTKTSELTNDSGFITLSDVPTIPTATSQLTNDSGFITASQVPNPDLSGYATKTELSGKADLNNSAQNIVANSISLTKVGYSQGQNTYIDFTRDNLIIEADSSFEVKVNGQRIMRQLAGDDSITFDKTVKAYYFNSISDKRLKTNIKDYKCEKSILDLPIKEFDYKKT